MNEIPSDFQFSQNNIQDYVDCPRRFELKHLLKVEWPALQSEPVLEAERRMNLGRQFHERVHQSLLGIPEERISAQWTEPEVAEWWQAYTQSNLLCGLPALRKAEFTLSAPFANYRLVAKYDLLAVEPGKYLTIVDWKTSARPASRAALLPRAQTRVYPLLAVDAGRSLFGSPVRPEQVEMIYWFTSAPEQAVHFQYSPQQYQADCDTLTRWITEISRGRPGQFSLTADERRCLYCGYRSLCNRGAAAGAYDESEWEDDPGAAARIPFDQIGEAEF